MSNGTLDELLRRTGRTLMLSTVGAGLAVGLAALLAALLVVVVIDAALGLPPAGLVVLNCILVATLLVAAAYVLRLAWQTRYRPRWVARLLETAAEIGDSRLINAVDLAGVGATAGGSRGAATLGFSDTLRQRAVARGHEVAAGLSPKLVVDRQRLMRAGGMLLAAVLVVGLTWAVVPRMFGAVLPRLASPFADLPPYTSVEFDIRVEPQPVLFGQPASVKVDLGGSDTPESASIVFVDEPTRPRLPMVRLASKGEGTNSFELRIERAERSRTFYVDTPAGRSGTFELTVKPVPLFEAVHVTYAYPAYTGWQPVTEPLPARGVRALVGTTVRFDVKSNVPLGEGRIVRLTEGQQPSAGDGGDGEVVGAIGQTAGEPNNGGGELVVGSDSRYALHLVGADGTPGLQPMVVDVTAVADAPPGVDIVEPTQRLFTPPDRPVQVRVAMRDDIGLSRAELHRGINGWGPMKVDLPLATTAPGRATAEATFDLPALGLAPGDVITYFAAVYDNRPGQPNLVESRVHTIEVISVEQWAEHMRTRRDAADVAAEAAEWNERLNELAERRKELADKLQALQDKIDAGQNLSADEQKQMAELTKQMSEFADAAGKLAEEMKARADERAVYDFEKPLHDQMRQTADQLRQQQAMAKELGEQMAAAKPGENGETAPLRGLTPQMQKFIKDGGPLSQEQQAKRQQTQADLDKLAAAGELLGAAETVRQIIAMQRDLTDRMATFRHVEQLDANQQLRAAQLAEEQATLKADLADAHKRLKELGEKHKDKLPKMSANADRLAQKLEQLRVERDQDSAERLAGAGRGRLAHASAEQAATKLESLLSDCQAQGNQMSDDLDGCLSLPRESWANAAEQMKAGMQPGIGLRGGRSGAGSNGSMAQVGIAGQAKDSRGDSDSRRNHRNANGRGQGGRPEGQTEDPDSAEQLNPDQTSDRRQGRGRMPGVPDKYRDEAEAYFRRLADENKE